MKKRIIGCKVSDAQFKNITNVADQLNMTKSDVIKLSLNDNLKKYRPINFNKKEKRHLMKNRSKALGKLAELSSISSDLSRRWLLAGNNINQIAHRLNMQDGKIDFVLDSLIEHLNNQLSSEQLEQQNNLMIRRLTEIWQLLE